MSHKKQQENISEQTLKAIELQLKENNDRQMQMMNKQLEMLQSFVTTFTESQRARANEVMAVPVQQQDPKQAGLV
jgi:hypothetical protein